MSNSITNLSINQEVLKIVRKIDRKLAKDIAEDVMSFAWYNGREAGVALAVGKLSYKRKQLVIVINESRNSDNLVVDAYEREWTTDQPCHNEKGYEKGYENRTYFRYDRHDAVVAHVLAAIDRRVGAK